MSTSPEETKRIATDFVNPLIPAQRATVIALYGDLGSGKTTFTQGIATALGVKESVTSPTFVLMKRYATVNSHFKQFIHIDAYRLQNGRDITVAGIGDVINDPTNFIVIEWPGLIQEALLFDMTKIVFTFIDDHTREIEFV